jgi:hypothetical protein
VLSLATRLDIGAYRCGYANAPISGKAANPGARPLKHSGFGFFHFAVI